MFGFVFGLVGRMVAFVAKATLFVGALVVVGAATMYALFDAEQYKRVVTQRLSDVTGRAVSIEGSAELHLSLPPRVVLNDVRIRNARWGTRTDMARIRRIEARLNPLRAIAGDSGMTDIRLEGVDLYLETGPRWHRQLGDHFCGGKRRRCGHRRSRCPRCAGSDEPQSAR